MKKVVPLFFVIVFLFNAIGYLLVFKIQQYQVKNTIESKIKAGIPTDELIAITINKNDHSVVQWLEEGKEIRYNGEMYDVVKSTETSNTIIYSCINDHKETALFSNLNDHINTHISAKPIKNSKKAIEITVVQLYFKNKQLCEFNITESTHLFLPTNSTAPSSLINTYSRPPKFA